MFMNVNLWTGELRDQKQSTLTELEDDVLENPKQAAKTRGGTNQEEQGAVGGAHSKHSSSPRRKNSKPGNKGSALRFVHGFCFETS